MLLTGLPPFPVRHQMVRLGGTSPPWTLATPYSNVRGGFLLGCKKARIAIAAEARRSSHKMPDLLEANRLWAHVFG